MFVPNLYLYAMLNLSKNAYTFWFSFTKQCYYKNPQKTYVNLGLQVIIENNLNLQYTYLGS